MFMKLVILHFNWDHDFCNICRLAIYCEHFILIWYLCYLALATSLHKLLLLQLSDFKSLPQIRAFYINRYIFCFPFTKSSQPGNHAHSTLQKKPWWAKNTSRQFTYYWYNLLKWKCNTASLFSFTGLFELFAVNKSVSKPCKLTFSWSVVMWKVNNFDEM